MLPKGSNRVFPIDKCFDLMYVLNLLVSFSEEDLNGSGRTLPHNFTPLQLVGGLLVVIGLLGCVWSQVCILSSIPVDLCSRSSGW